jgi:hypothetical protein
MGRVYTVKDFGKIPVIWGLDLETPEFFRGFNGSSPWS